VIALATPWWRRINDAINFIAFIDIWGIIVITTFTAWVVRMRMRRRVRMDLGKTVDDNDLLSIQTWMKVDEIEKTKNPCREWAPRSTVIDYQSSKAAPSLLSVLKLLVSGGSENQAQHRRH
jgi:hypothetical protein